MLRRYAGARLAERVGDALHAMLEACSVRAVISLEGMATFDEAGRAMRREVTRRVRADPGFLAATS